MKRTSTTEWLGAPSGLGRVQLGGSSVLPGLTHAAEVSCQVSWGLAVLGWPS